MPAFEAGEPCREMNREVFVGGRWCTLKKASPGLQPWQKRLLEKSRGETTEGEFGAVVGVSIVRDMDDFYREHTFQEFEAGRGAGFRKPGNFHDLRKAQVFFGNEEGVVDPGYRPWKAEGFSDPCEVGCHGFGRRYVRIRCAQIACFAEFIAAPRPWFKNFRTKKTNWGILSTKASEKRLCAREGYFDSDTAERFGKTVQKIGFRGAPG